MKRLYENSKTIVVALSSVACFTFITHSPVTAQSTNPRLTGAARRVERMQRQNENYERDKLEREMERGRGRPTGHRNEADAAQLRQDFEKLQSTYNRIVLVMAANQALQPEAVLEDVAEIRKAAVRLKTKLALPESDQVEQRSTKAVPPQFPDVLLKLRQHIYDFLTNPLFDRPGAYKVDEAKKASGDLDKIIEVSQSIGKNAGSK